MKMKNYLFLLLIAATISSANAYAMFGTRLATSKASFSRPQTDLASTIGKGFDLSDFKIPKIPTTLPSIELPEIRRPAPKEEEEVDQVTTPEQPEAPRFHGLIPPGFGSERPKIEIPEHGFGDQLTDLLPIHDGKPSIPWKGLNIPPFVPTGETPLVKQVDYKLRIGDQLILPPVYASIPNEIFESVFSILRVSNGISKEKFEAAFLTYEAYTRRLQSITISQAEDLHCAINTVELLLETAISSIFAYDDFILQALSTSQQVAFELYGAGQADRARTLFFTELKNIVEYFSTAAFQFQQWALEVVRSIAIESKGIADRETLEKLLTLTRRFITASAEGSFLPNRNTAILFFTGSDSFFFTGTRTLENILEYTRTITWEVTEAQTVWINTVNELLENYQQLTSNIPPRFLFISLRQFSSFFQEFKDYKCPLNIGPFESLEEVFIRQSEINSITPERIRLFPSFNYEKGIKISELLTENGRGNVGRRFIDFINNQIDLYTLFGNSKRIISLLSQDGAALAALPLIEARFRTAYILTESINDKLYNFYRILSAESARIAGGRDNEEFYSEIISRVPDIVHTYELANENLIQAQSRIFLLSRWILISFNDIETPSVAQKRFIQLFFRWRIWNLLEGGFTNLRFQALLGITLGVSPAQIVENSQITLQFFKDSIPEIPQILAPENFLGLSSPGSPINLPAFRTPQPWIVEQYETEVQAIIPVARSRATNSNSWDRLINPDQLYNRRVRKRIDELADPWLPVENHLG